MSPSCQRSLEIEPLLHHISLRTGLSFRPIGHKEFATGIRQIMERYSILSIGDLIEQLAANRDVFDAVISEVTIGESYFFRDSGQFEAIRSHILPSLIHRGSYPSPIRIWSAGCSTGEEAYSLAILMEQEGYGKQTQILATDISRTALRIAKRAEYGRWSLRNSEAGVSKYICWRPDERLRIIQRLRRRVRFKYLNLASDTYPTFSNGTARNDLILCRNVLIYFGLPFVEHVAKRLFDSLANGGWLITGPSDPPIWDYAPFETVTTAAGVIYRRARNVAVSHSQKGAVHTNERTRTSVVRRTSRNRPPVAPSVSPDPLSKGKTAYAAGRNLQVMEPTGRMEEPASMALRIRALCNAGRLVEAERTANSAVALHRHSAELHYLQGVLLIARGFEEKAVKAFRRSLYMDPKLAASYFALGSIWQRSDKQAALRAFASGRSLCVARPPAEIVPLTDGETAGKLVEIARERIDHISALLAEES